MSSRSNIDCSKLRYTLLTVMRKRKCHQPKARKHENTCVRKHKHRMERKRAFSYAKQERLSNVVSVHFPDTQNAPIRELYLRLFDLILFFFNFRVAKRLCHASTRFVEFPRSHSLIYIYIYLGLVLDRRRNTILFIHSKFSGFISLNKLSHNSYKTYHTDIFNI